MSVVFEDIIPALNRLEVNLTTGVQRKIGVIGDRILVNIQDNMRAGIDIDGVPYKPNTPATLEKKLTRTVLIETSDLLLSWRKETTQNQVELFTEQVYAATMQYGAKKGQFGSMSNGNPIPWGDIPPRKMIPNDNDPTPPAWEKIIQEQLEPLLDWS